MPRRDGTGPSGAGLMIGRGLGNCVGANAVQYGAGHGRGTGHGRGSGRGFASRCGFECGLGRGFAANQTSTKTQKELLNKQKTMLQERLGVIDKQLESL